MYDFILIKSIKKKERSFKLLYMRYLNFFSPPPHKNLCSEIWETGWFVCCCLIWLLGEGSLFIEIILYVEEIDRKQTCFL